MLFYRNAQSLSIPCPQLSENSGSAWIKEVEEALLNMWMLKCFLMGVALLGMVYCVVHVSGLYERSLTLTFFTILCFLLIYILWCSHQKQHHLSQVRSIVSIALTRYEIL
jgi:hypothetical protein